MLSRLWLVFVNHISFKQRRQNCYTQIPIQFSLSKNVFIPMAGPFIFKQSPDSRSLCKQWYKCSHSNHMPLHWAYTQDWASLYIFGVSYVRLGTITNMLALAQAVLLELFGLAGHCHVCINLLSVRYWLSGLFLRGHSQTSQSGSKNCSTSHLQRSADLFKGYKIWSLFNMTELLQ
jgi:hypothetical protein